MAPVFAALLALLTTLAPILQAQSWIGARPGASTLAGKVVVLDVFTFDCINCKHVVPELRRLRSAIPQRDLVILGIHSPETPFERDRGNVAAALREQGITWPVAIDNDFSLWHAYGAQYWPTQLIFDRGGRLRKTIIGEGQDTQVAAAVQQLLGETAAERDFRLTVRGNPGALIPLRAGVPHGWIAAFCTASVCAREHVSVRVPASGRAVVALHLYRISDTAPRTFNVSVHSGDTRFTLPVDMPR